MSIVETEVYKKNHQRRKPDSNNSFFNYASVKITLIVWWLER